MKTIKKHKVYIDLGRKKLTAQRWSAKRIEKFSKEFECIPSPYGDGMVCEVRGITYLFPITTEEVSKKWKDVFDSGKESIEHCKYFTIKNRMMKKLGLKNKGEEK